MTQCDLMVALKRHALVGDSKQVAATCHALDEKSAKLCEICRMLREVSPSNRMKMIASSLGSWFDTNSKHLVGVATCLCNSPRSKVAKQCLKAYTHGKCDGLS